jgi:hypothetical protein
VGLRASLETETTGKTLCLCRGSNPGGSVAQSVVRHYVSGYQTFFADGTLKLCNIIVYTNFFLSANDTQVFFCYDGCTAVVKAATLRIVQSV